MDGTGRLFQSFVEALGGEFNVQTIAYPLSESLNYAELTAFATSALPRAGPLVILGESFSGPIAVEMAARCAQRVRGLILCSTFVRDPRPRWSWLAPLLPVVPIAVLPTRALAQALFGRHSNAPLRAELAHALAAVAPDVLQSRLLAVRSVDACAALARLRVPLLYLQAREDRLVPASAFAIVKHLCPSVRVEAFDAPHALLQVRPFEAADAVKRFMREVVA